MERLPARFDDEAERSSIGACLVSVPALEMVAELLEPADFFRPEHREAYAAVLSLRERRVTVDAISLADELERRGKLDVSAKLLVHELEHAAGTASGALQHARIVRDLSRRRELVRGATALEQIGSNGADLSQALDTVERLSELVRDDVRGDRPSPSIDGAAFVLDQPSPPCLWGSGESVLWEPGESLFLVGPSGVGKTTLVQQLALARAGLRAETLGFPVAADDRRVLYVAADRPTQIARSLRRMVSEEDRDALRERLTFWRGPLERDLVSDPDGLVRLAEQHDAGTLIVDSLKDVAFDLSKDESGSRVNSALQRTVRAGVELVVVHHQRKAQQQGGKPTKLADVYGSVWLTAGAGSVLLLWGEPGDAIVELSHLKQPLGAVGPLKVLHDHYAGNSTVEEHVDLVALVLAARTGLSAQEAARKWLETLTPTKNEVERTRRELNGYVRAGKLSRVDGRAGGRGGGEPTRWFGAAREPSKSVHESVHGGVAGETAHEAVTAFTSEPESAGQDVHATVHGVHDSERSRSAPSLEGERAPDEASDRETEKALQRLLEALPGSEVVE